MRDELDRKLVEKYPLVFEQRSIDLTETAMCWGFCVADGWYGIIDALCETLYSGLNRAKGDLNYYESRVGKPSVPYDKESRIVDDEFLEELRAKVQEESDAIPRAVQVKEKFGGLRFYVDRATREQHNMIGVFEDMSYRVCEDCGMMDDSVRTWDMGWSLTLCKNHAIDKYGQDHVDAYLECLPNRE